MRVRTASTLLLIVTGLVLALMLGEIWLARLPYPFDLEWMEGGMLAHAWWLLQGHSLYGPPDPEFTPFIYPPGYPTVVAGLGAILGLSPVLGRLVSIVAIVAAAGAIAVGVRQQGGSWPIATAAGLTFLGAYPQSGAFYDLVRPDSLAVALLGWSIVVALRQDRRAPMISGLLLATAFLCKHNVAIFGIPMVLGLWRRDLRAALTFAVTSAGTALLAVALIQWRSAGHFLTYLLEVPSAHAMLWERAFVHTPRELGTALPVALGLAGWAVYLQGLRTQRGVPAWIAAGLPMLVGIGVAWAATYYPPPPESGALLVPTFVAYWGLCVGVISALIRLVGTALAPASGDPLSFKALYGLGIASTAVISAMLMRAHDGGFVNVHIPLFWVVSFAAGIAATRASRHGPLVTAGIHGLLALQLVYAIGLCDRSRLVPTEEDEAIGWAFVEHARDVEGPVLSPFASWLPVYAGKAPSVHAMALWDLDRRGGPYEDELGEVRRALRERYWVLAFGGNHGFLGPLAEYYDPIEVVVEHESPLFRPRTGYFARPWRLMVPRPGVE